MRTVAFPGGSGTIRIGKDARRNECFPFLFENDGKMLELGVSWVGFFLLLCLAFFSFSYFFSLKEKKI